MKNSSTENFKHGIAKPVLYEVLFDNLVKNLRKNGYKVTVTLEDKYRFARVKGKWIIAGFCEPNNGESYSYIDGKICFDNVKCFDKLSKCPYCRKKSHPDEVLDFEWQLRSNRFK